MAIAGATILFGTATPLLKILVDGMAPLFLIALLALGSGTGVLELADDERSPLTCDTASCR